MNVSVDLQLADGNKVTSRWTLRGTHSGNLFGFAATRRPVAVSGIIGFVDVPIVYESVNWWNTIHPTQFVLEGNLPGPMLLALMIAFGTITLLFVFLLIQAYKLRSLTDATEELRAIVESEEEEKVDQHRDFESYSASGRS